MTNEELTQLVHQGDPKKLVEALLPLDEAARRKLAKHAVRLVRASKKAIQDVFIQVGRENRGTISTAESRIKQAGLVEAVAELAALGVCAWSDVRRIEMPTWRWPDDYDDVFALLRARKPEWIDRWVEEQFNLRWMCPWGLVRQLVRAGACRRPTDEGYIRTMIHTRAGWRHDRGTLADVLREDNLLLEHEIWRIFEIDLSRGQWLTPGDIDWKPRPQPQPPIKPHDHRPTSWGHTLAALAGTGELDRGRLLTASLQALARPVLPANAGWFCRFHELLEPTPEERIERQALYRNLLASQVPIVVGLALDAMKAIAVAGKFEALPFVEAVAPVFDLRPKMPPVHALRVLKLAVKHDPSCGPAVALAAAAGLNHASSDVQKTAADLIDQLAVDPDAALAAALERHQDSVAPSIRSRLQSILARVSAQGTAAPSSSPGVPLDGVAPSTQDVAESAALIQQAQTLPASWREMAGVNAAIDALTHNREIPDLELDPMAVPRLDPSTRLPPIASLDELIERLSTAVERLESADELELLLDGLSRFADRRPIDFAARTAPLLKRAGDLLRHNPWGVNALDPHTQLLHLVGAWVEGRGMATSEKVPGYPCVDGFLVRRLAALSIRLKRRTAGSLLACPTHRGGWIDPIVFARRLQSWQELCNPTEILDDSRGPGRLEWIQALLRLAPDGRDVTRELAAGLKSPARALVMFALGGPTPAALKSSAIDEDLWVAAARARDPRGDFRSLFESENLGPDAARPAVWEWSTKLKPQRYLGTNITGVTFLMQPDLQTARNFLDRPTVLLHLRHGNDWSFDTLAAVRCRAAVWPANPDAYYAMGVGAIMNRLHDPASTFSPTAPYLEPLFDSDNPFTPMAQLVLAVALNAKDPGTRGLAVDAAIALIEDGRMRAAELGATLAKLNATPGTVMVNRLGSALAEVARVSELHRQAVAGVAQHMLSSLPNLGRAPQVDLNDLGAAGPGDAGLHHLLSPVLEWLTESGQAVADYARPALSAVKVTGMTGKLAAELLGLREHGFAPARRAAAAAVALRGRMDRAARWARAADK